MPCRGVPLPGGSYAIVCSRNKPSKPCRYCGRPGGKLCDFPLTGAKQGSTCDIPMCERCTTHVEPDTDYCRAHAKIKGLG